MPLKQSARHYLMRPGLFRILLIIGIFLISIVILAIKEENQANIRPITADLPIVQLDRALKESQPTLAFFHSNTCQQCIEMIDTITQVYPTYADSIILVDVNVYDDRNQPLLQRFRLQYIPTLIFFDQNGKSLTHIGGMEANQLSAVLDGLNGGK